MSPREVRESVSADVYVQIQQFYATQMRLLDTGHAEEWADTFTDDGVFHQSVARPLRGREEIARAARRRVDDINTEGWARRHWLAMLEVQPAEDGAVTTRYYGVAMATPSNGSLTVYASTSCADTLVVEDGRWLVRHRWVEHDGKS